MLNLVFSLYSFVQYDPLNSRSGYRRVDTGGESLSTSATATSLNTFVLDTNAENLISLDTETTAHPRPQPNPFIHEFKLNAPPKSALKDSKISFDEEFEDEAADRIGDDFLSQRAHFQKYKSQSSATKRLLLNVSRVFKFRRK